MSNHFATFISTRSFIGPGIRRLSRYSSRTLRLSALLFLLFSLSPLRAQEQNPQSAVDSLMRSSLKVDPATGAMQMQIPLGEYKGRGGASLPITLFYSSKLWNIKYISTAACSGEPVSAYWAEYAKGSASGWTSSLGWFLPQEDLPWEVYDMSTKKPAHTSQSGLREIARKFVRLPDGSRHELRRDDDLHVAPDSHTGTYVSVDGSRLKYDTATSTLWMADGSRFVGTQYIDRNGNTLTYSSGAWTDTLGRTLTPPVPGTKPSAPDDVPVTLPGFNNSPITYVMKWRKLGDVRTVPSPDLKYKGDSPTANCNPGGFQSDSLFHSVDAQQKVLQQEVFEPIVLSEIVLPNGRSYKFTYNVYGEINHIEYPTGGTEGFAYDEVTPLGGQLDDGTFGQANRGVVSRTVSDGLTSQTWLYGADATPGVDSNTVAKSVTSPALPDGTKTRTVSWYYKSRSADIQYGFDDARTGMTREERVYALPPSYPAQEGTMLRRTVYQLTEDGPQGGGYATATRNARVTKKLDIILDTDGDALAALTEMTYDSDLNLITTKRYDYFPVIQSSAQNDDIPAILSGKNLTLLRTEETDFGLSADQNYRDRNLISLPTATRVKDGSENIVAQSAIAYDETALQTIGTTTGWIDPQTTYRGNPTTTSSWLNTTNTWLATHATYDQFGNVRTATDAKGNQSLIDYSSTYSYAYPTQATTADPDGAGPLTALTSTTEYDASTGLPTATVDANLVRTTFAYNDPLNRLTQTVRAANGAANEKSQTTIAYNDAARTITTTSDQSATSVVKSAVLYDALGRVSQKHQYETATTFIAVKMKYDDMGRAYRVSNPYRTDNPNLSDDSLTWIETAFDPLGRAISVTTKSDNAVVATSYRGNTVTVTDQALKKRRSVTDALGRLVRVDEPDDNGNLDDDQNGAPLQPTVYGYDPLDNLTTVNQGSQSRYFKYDSLKRLIRARNPEQDVNANLNLADSQTGNSQWSIAYGYDENGNVISKTDPRNVTTTYAYDALNRVKSRDYSDSTPDVTYAYDSLTNGKGRLTSISSSVSSYAFTGYDRLGNVTAATQTIGSQNYSLSYDYDLAGHVSLITYPSGHSVTYNYDASGRLADKDSSHLAFTGNLGDGVTRTYAAGIAYSPFGGMSKEQFGTNTPIYHKLHYNVRGQLYDVRASTVNDDSNWNRGAILNYYSLANYGSGTSGKDNNGNLYVQQHWVPADDAISGYTMHQQNYSYDALNRLDWIEEYLNGAVPGTGGQSYSYDRYGNRTISGAYGAGINNKPFTVDANTNRLTVPNGQSGTMHYDAAGNLDVDTYSGSAVARIYDAENRMTKETQAGPNDAGIYAYDADGRRVKRTVGGVETWQVYGISGELLAEYAANSSAQSPQKEYGYRNGELLVTAAPTTSTYALQALVTGKALGAQRADAPGWTGFQMTVGSQPITVNTLGRQCSAYNSGTHELKLIRASDNVAVASANANMGGCTVGQFKYANLSTPVTLSANTAYLLVSNEVGGDLFHDWANTVLTTTSAATVNHGVYPINGGQSWGVAGSTGNSYVPLDLQYQVPPSQPFVTGKTLAAQRADAPGWAGFEMSVGTQPITLTSLGRHCSAGNSLTHEVRVIRSSDNSVVASTNVAMSGCTAGTTQYASLANPVTLSANTSYRVVSYEVGGDLFHDWTGLSLTTTAAATVLHGVYTTDGGQTWGSAGGSNNSYVPVDFQYQASAIDGVDLRWLVMDHLGTPRMIFDQTGSLANMNRHDYLPFGEELFAGTSGRTTAQGYTNSDNTRQRFGKGYERDTETSLDYAKARYYANVEGRFTSVDPLMASAKLTVPQSWNRYIYCVANPLKFIDPTGMIWAYHYLDKDRKQIGISWFDKKKDIPQGYQQLAFGKDGVKSIGLADGTTAVLHARSSVAEIYGHPSSQANKGYVNSGLVNEIAKQVAPIPKATAVFAGASVVGGLAGGAALATTGALSGSGITTLGLAEGGASAAPEAAATLLPQFSNSTLNEAVETVLNDPNKVNHIFGDAGHNLDGLVNQLGEEGTMRAVLNGLNGNLPSNGVFEANSVVNGINVTVRGNVIDGAIRIGTMFVP